MGFLDNSGDIILDAVLTDTGRMRLAKGDGSFKITKFALGDDEINYGLYKIGESTGNKDTDLMNTPIFEAFTNNLASLNSRLISIARTDHLYLPVILVNPSFSPSNHYALNKIVSQGYIVAVDKITEDMFNSVGLTYVDSPVSLTGIMNGFSMIGGSHIRLDQGINNAAINAATKLDPDLRETQYLVEVDNRLLSIISPVDQNMDIQYSYVDDDDIAGYFFSLGDSTNLVALNTDTTTTATGTQSVQVIAGARGTTLHLKLKSSIDTSTSDYIFNQIGTDVTSMYKINNLPVGTNIRSIMTNIRVTGLTTGYAVDVPIVVVKKIT